MPHLRNIALLVILPLLVFSCLDNPNPSASGRAASLPNVTGAAGEVLVVMDNNLWKSQAGVKLRESLEQQYPALPQPEPLFDLIHIPNGAFDELFQMHRSIIMSDVSSVHASPEIKFSENTWAKPQIVIRLLAPDTESLNTLISENYERLVNTLLQYDRNRLADVYRSGRDINTKTLLSRFGLDLAIPRGYNIDIDSKNFVSLSIEASQTSQVVFIYRYPVKDKYDLTTERLIEKRNEFLSIHTQGSQTGSYMTTATILPPMAYDLKKKGQSFVEIRGLWELNKGYMGGPFISHTTIDTLANEIITVEAYVYNPNNKKRNLMRQMEAIVYSFELVK